MRLVGLVGDSDSWRLTAAVAVPLILPSLGDGVFGTGGTDPDNDTERQGQNGEQSQPDSSEITLEPASQTSDVTSGRPRTCRFSPSHQ